jgi:hypothetical protein
MSFTVSVAGRIYHLPPDADVGELRDRLVTAVRDGGDVVAIPGGGDGSVSVLVSPGLPVFLEESADDASPQPSDAEANERAFLDALTVQEWDSF